MRRTLLDMVQDILSDMDSDEVNSISDTVESQQVMRIIKTTYYNIVDSKHWTVFNKLFQLEPQIDINHPTLMKLPEDIVQVQNVHFIRYNKKMISDTFDKYAEVYYMEPYQFLDHVGHRHNDANNVQVVTDPSGVTFNLLNDRAPSYYTSFDDSYLVFDSFDSAVDDTLQGSKTKCYGKMQPAWDDSDDFIPLLPIDAFSYLLNEAKSIAFVTLKQMPNQKAEQHSITQRRKMSQDAFRIKRGIQRPDFGRKIKWHQ